MPHALVHAKESVMRGGHHGAYCTSLAETAHKMYIKMASRFSRTYSSRNTTQEHMLTWVLRQKLWEAVMKIQVPHDGEDHQNDSDADASTVEYRNCLQQPLALMPESLPPTRGLNNQALRIWRDTVLSKNVIVSRSELLSLLRTKLQLHDTRRNNNFLLEEIQWKFFGVFVMDTAHGFRRRFVGHSTISKGRRDFVRIQGTENNTVLSAQIITFISLSGFCDNQSDGITLPIHLRISPTKTDEVVLCLIRWLEPHPDARIRDKEHRPVCPAPFNINHSLWRFARLRRDRTAFAPATINKQLHLFDGHGDAERRIQADRHKLARYDLVEPETFESFMNCTILNEDTGTILETNTLPCNVTRL